MIRGPLQGHKCNIVWVIIMLHTVGSICGPIRMQQTHSKPDPANALSAQWIKEILEREEISEYELAKRSGASKQSIGRARKGLGINLENLRKIGSATVVPPPEGLFPINMNAAHASGLADRGQPPLRIEDVAQLPTQMRPANTNQHCWRLRDRSLELPPYSLKQGDLLLVDHMADRRPGMVVCAQIYDLRGGAETEFRGYEPPYLVTATLDEKVKRPPVHVESAAIWGPVIRVHREY